MASTVAPWALSAGVLVSFTASAGQKFDTDARPETLILRAAPGADSALVDGPSMLVAASSFRMPALNLNSAVRQAYLSFDDPERRVVIDPRLPREEMKRSASGFPEVDRSAKGDLLPGLRPTLTNTPRNELARVVFSDHEPGLISGGFSLEALKNADKIKGPPIGFERDPDDEGLTDPALSDASPRSFKPLITSAREAELHIESIDGSTPYAKRTHVTGSATPVVSYAVVTAPTPGSPPGASIKLASLGGQPGATSTIGKSAPADREIYTGLIPPEKMASEQRCLSEAVYFEARSESEAGRAAVAQVVLNRVKSGLYPNSVCGVVYQNSHRHLACQFTFTCEGKSLRITEPGPWREAVRIAREVYEGQTYLSEVGASTHYHADYVRPRWARKLKKMDTIGQHIFYKLRPGQT